jgi:glucokinase
MNLLAADIGGTNSRLAWIADGDIHTENYRNVDFSDLYQVIERFLRDRGGAGASMERMVLALPGPADADRVHLTNIDWEVERVQLEERFAVKEAILINDFQAAAMGALHAPSRQVLNPGTGTAMNAAAVVTGVGTGLGLAWCPDTAACELPYATEGGHADFAPATAEECELHAWLAERHGHVSWERVLSGEGLRNLYRFFSGRRDDAPTAAQIDRLASDGEALALRVMDSFVAALGRYTGNLALQFNPGAGVYLCGGVAMHLGKWITGGIGRHYLDKGRMREQAARIPAYLVDRHDIGLMGAIQIARGVEIGTA